MDEPTDIPPPYTPVPPDTPTTGGQVVDQAETHSMHVERSEREEPCRRWVRFVECGLCDPVTQTYRPVTEIVGAVAAARLNELGVHNAHQLVGYYMYLNMDDHAFDHWLETVVNVPRPIVRAHYTEAMRMWCTAHV